MKIFKDIIDFLIRLFKKNTKMREVNTNALKEVNKETTLSYHERKALKNQNCRYAKTKGFSYIS